MTDAHGKIKKLTADKIRDNLAHITRKNGDIDLADRGIEAILSLDGLQRATKLDLSRNKLTKLSDLKRVQGLTMLKLTDNCLNGEVRAQSFGCDILLALRHSYALQTLTLTLLGRVRTLVGSR